MVDIVKYTKINTIYKRDPENNNKTLLEGQYSIPAFEYLADTEWVFTEKIDGTNTRIIWEDQTMAFGGRTDNAQIPVPLITKLQEIFNPSTFDFIDGEAKAILFGEGYGAKIQKGGGNYIPDGVDFILFDVWIEGVYLEQSKVCEIADMLELQMVPIIGTGTLKAAVEMVRDGFPSILAQVSRAAEGIVMRPRIELLDRLGNRIISKIKTRDFRR